MKMRVFVLTLLAMIAFASNSLLCRAALRDTGIDAASFSVVADFAIDGVAAGQELAKKFKPLGPGTWELKLAKPVTELAKGTLKVCGPDSTLD